MQGIVRAFWSALDWPLKAMSYLLIQIYRYSLSAVIGRNCRHLPSCSEYTRDAIWRHGFWPGGWMGAARIVRCRPGGTHGYDPVPETMPQGAHWYMPWRYGFWR